MYRNIYGNMRFISVETVTLIQLILLFGSVSSVSKLAELQTTVKDEYIVGLKPTSNPAGLVKELSQVVINKDASAVITHTYFIGILTGFAFKGNDGVFDELKRHPSVDAVTPNVELTVESSANDLVIERVDKQSGLPYTAWGLARICSTKQLKRESELRYRYEARAGEGTYIYIIDTVVDVNHNEFEDRASFGINAVDENVTFPSQLLSHEWMDHGTHVAGIVASKTYGVAKKTKIVSVNVAQWNDVKNRSVIEIDDVMEALEWVRNHHKGRKNAGKGAKSVINLSLGRGNRSDVNLKRAVEAVVDSGVSIVVAAGNDGEDACEAFTPVGDSKVISVGCSDIKDQFCTFSNHGKCVDIVAPGLQIPSTLPNNTIGIKNGTSMSAPHVTGVIARYLANGDSSTLPVQVKNWLLSNALNNEIHFTEKEGNGTPNRLVYMQPDEGHFTTANPTTAIVLGILIIVFIVTMVTCTVLKRKNMLPCDKTADYSVF
ncbi:subtilisin-like protease CPC735_066880 isoform X2 [Lingula anatina]|uniref:Subtilisin-like protease CPC735_066880 isoform X2 n=1 Tax=Lingula anatina TaxID=7574 RepID=A0A1S3INM3_LINAN|nr:subtilisin-like protease CPC735_066880 isoform X2 [Lingula anatina]|eukprot:XP_013399802.1 subtilisin-like protease CPC735_066880 isoform X2 [Lingula anatina]